MDHEEPAKIIEKKHYIKYYLFARKNKQIRVEILVDKCYKQVKNS